MTSLDSWRRRITLADDRLCHLCRRICPGDHGGRRSGPAGVHRAGPQRPPQHRDRPCHLAGAVHALPRGQGLSGQGAEAQALEVQARLRLAPDLQGLSWHAALGRGLLPRGAHRCGGLHQEPPVRTVTAAAELLHGWLRGQLAPDALEWLDAQVRTARRRDERSRFLPCRQLRAAQAGQGRPEAGSAGLAAADAVRSGWDPSDWSVDQAARILLLLAGGGDGRCVCRSA